MKWLILYFVLFSYVMRAQNHDNIWMIGDGNTQRTTVLNFSNDSMRVDTIIRNMPFLRAGVSMSDSVGSLIFYSNGIKINNAQYQLMQNGDGLNPGQPAIDFANSGYPIHHSIISIHNPIYSNKYYLFHQSATYASDMAGLGEHLYYTVIDMNANAGLGRVEQKNQILTNLPDSTANGQLQMVKHANGQDWWLVQPMAWSNGYYTFLVTGDTILLAHKQYIGNPNMFGNQTWMGQSVFSPDGSKYARYDWKNDIDILSFDRCTGLFSNPIHIPIQDTIDVFGGTFAGVAISPSSQYLYVSSYNVLYQVDLWAANIAASMDTVAVHDGYVNPAYPLPTIFRFLRLGPDNKIYIMSDVYSLHTIESPDSGGTSCNVQQRSVTSYNINNAYLPNFPHYRTPPLSTPCDTTTSVVAVVEEEEWEVLLFPNPTNKELTIQSNLLLEDNSNIEIYNSLGQNVKVISTNKDTQTVQIDVSHLLDGIYFMRLKNGESIITKSFIVSK